MTFDPPSPDAARADAPIATLALKPFRRPPRLVVLVTAATATAFTLTARQIHPSPALFVAVYALLGLLVAVAYRRRRFVERAPIAVTIDAVVFPTNVFSTRMRTIPLADVTSIEERGSRSRRLLVVGTRQRPYLLPTDAFVDAGGVDRLRQAVRAVMTLQPGGFERVAEMSEREAAGRSAGRRPPRATMALIAAVGVVFALELALGALDENDMLLRLGANSPALVRHGGQWWRPITANLLHLSFLHLYFNAAALLSLGTMVERSLGTPRFVVAALLAGVAGHLTTVLAGRAQIVSAGASAIAFGLMGALLLVNVLHRRRLAAGFVIGWRQWAFLLGINAAISMLPMVDGLAHLGGLLGGALPTLVFAWRLEMGPRMRAVCRTVAAGLVALYVAGVGAAAFHFLADGGDPSNELAAASLSLAGRDGVQLNDVAWSIAIDPASTPAMLARAEEAARRAVEAEPRIGNLLDTQAYLLHRLGRADEALRLERRAAWLTQIRPIFTMLHRFLVERRASGGTGARVEWARDDADAAGRASADGASGKDVVVEAPGRAGAVVYASVVVELRSVGLLRVVLPVGADRARLTPPASFPRNARFDVLLADASLSRAEEPATEIRAAYEPLDPATLELP